MSLEWLLSMIQRKSFEDRVKELSEHLNRQVTVFYTETQTGSNSAHGNLTSVSPDYVQIDSAKLYFRQGDRFWIESITSGAQVIYRKG